MIPIIVYTALVGDYDLLKEHDHPREASFCFTDQRGIATRSWTLVPIDTLAADIDARIRIARYHKTQPHRVLPPHRHSIWIDASMQITAPIARAVEILEGRELATFKYPDVYGPRACAYDEAAACIRRGKDAADVIERQMQRYAGEGFPHNFGLAETTIVVRADTPAIARFNDAWWREISRGSRRDQLSFDYTCWREGISYAWLPGHRLQNPFARYVPHLQQIYTPREGT